MFLGRIAFFRLHESPRFLVTNGRHSDALEIVHDIAKFNGRSRAFGLEDVRLPSSFTSASHARVPTSTRHLSPPTPSRLLDSPHAEFKAALDLSHTPPRSSSDGIYNSTSTSGPPRPQYPFKTPTREQSALFLDELRESAAASAAPTERDAPPQRNRLERSTSSHSMSRRQEDKSGAAWSTSLRASAVEALEETRQKLAALFTRTWRRTTILMWILWGAMSLGPSIFSAVLDCRLTVWPAGIQQASPCSTRSSRSSSRSESTLPHPGRPALSRSRSSSSSPSPAAPALSCVRAC